MGEHDYEEEAYEADKMPDKWRELTFEDEEAYAEDGEYDYIQAEDLAKLADTALETKVEAQALDVAAGGAFLDTSKLGAGATTTTLNLGEVATTTLNTNSASGVSDATVVSGGAGTVQQVRIHRHDMPIKIEQQSSVGTIIWVLVILHLLALAVSMRVWWRQRRTKDPTMRAAVAPPQKQTCTYDMDKSFAVPKIELPLKALKLAKA